MVSGDPRDGLSGDRTVVRKDGLTVAKIALTCAAMTGARKDVPNAAMIVRLNVVKTDAQTTETRAETIAA